GIGLENDIIFILHSLSARNIELLQESDYRKRHIAIISYMSGARGDVGNILSAASTLGQFYAGDGSRPGSNISRLSHYSEPDSIDIFDRGMIRSCYADGLSPKEVMTIADASRMQAFQTYLGTPQSGNASRQLIL